MVEQPLDMLCEANCVWHLQMCFERCFVDPARMDEEQIRIPRRVVGLMRKTTGVFSRRRNFLPE